jgi:hypothetical protein
LTQDGVACAIAPEPIGMGWIAAMVLLIAVPSALAGESAYGLARFEVPDGRPIGRLFGSYVCGNDTGMQLMRFPFHRTL